MKPAKLTDEQRAVIQNLTSQSGADLRTLVRIAGLNPKTDLVGADFRGADFGTDDLTDFNLSRADLRGARLADARNLDRAMFADIIEDEATRWPPRLRDRPGDVIQDGATMPELILIPPGSFLMGVSDKENVREKVPKVYRGWSNPQHTVTIAQAFHLGRYPVTRGQFAAFVAATGHSTPTKAWTYEKGSDGDWTGAERDNRDWRNPGFAQTDRDPVVCVSHDDAVAYVRWLSDQTGKRYRLPSEAEWEYAARAGTVTARFWGDDRRQACRYANVADETLRKQMGAKADRERFFPCDDGFAFTSPVGSFQPNGFGLYDMLGNVWEWTADHWQDNYDDAPSDGSPNTTPGGEGSRVLRGGSWVDSPRDVRAGNRFRNDSGIRDNDTGFRAARTL